MQVGFGDSVEFRLQLRGTRRRTAERIELHGKVAVALNGAEKLGGTGGLSKQRDVVCSGRRRLSGELFSDSEELAPGFIDRCWIALIRLVRLRDVAVVEDARER